MDEQEQKSENTKAPSEAKNDKGKPMPKFIWAVIGLLILIAIVILVLRGGGAVTAPGVTPTPATQPETATGDVMVGKDAIAVTDYSAGETVIATIVVLSKPGYVVVHMEADGAPGAVIGNSTLLPSGESNNVVVSLSRPSTGGEVLYAMLHTDNGDGLYAFPGDDLPTKDEEGNVVLMKFTVGVEE